MPLKWPASVVFSVPTAGNLIYCSGLILARCGSKGIRLKNLVTIENESLLRRTLVTLKKCGKFASIWVATDCNTIAHEALLSGARVFRRSSLSATDTAPSIMAVEEFLMQRPEVNIVALFQCTSPFLALPFIHRAFELLSQGYDSVFSANRVYKLRWHLTSGGVAQAGNFDPARRPRRQDWSGELVENGMFYFVARHLVEEGLLQGGR
ncbi:N-acylneuraminate cytidylyltransferase [Thrips palmi]|uniref:N-acylneuraminate cytidylyltransferase n=1 Tax=Thrips palmi TaxID=161013 RepID=A0A6P8ZSV6_THRPL|nr:N-acylneuraminate cytidylyltransferase [Thrips palmi]